MSDLSGAFAVPIFNSCHPLCNVAKVIKPVVKVFGPNFVNTPLGQTLFKPSVLKATAKPAPKAQVNSLPDIKHGFLIVQYGRINNKVLEYAHGSKEDFGKQ